MGCTNHGIDLLLGKNSLNRQGVRLIGVEPGLGSAQNLEDAGVQALRCGSPCHPHVDKVGLAVGRHIDQTETAPGETRVNPQNAGSARNSRGGFRALV